MLAKTWPRLGGLPELKTFECEGCSIVFTEVATGEAPIQERVIALHQEPYHQLH
jgi:hypothetical protein